MDKPTNAILSATISSCCANNNGPVAASLQAQPLNTAGYR